MHVSSFQNFRVAREDDILLMFFIAVKLAATAQALSKQANKKRKRETGARNPTSAKSLSSQSLASSSDKSCLIGL